MTGLEPRTTEIDSMYRSSNGHPQPNRDRINEASANDTLNDNYRDIVETREISAGIKNNSRKDINTVDLC